MFSLTWLPEVLLAAGLKVAETSDWRTRGRAEMDILRGVMCHHTATPRRIAGNMPTLNLLISGRAAAGGVPALQGPLAQLGLGRDGTFYVIAAGRANHAGSGKWAGLVDVGNSSFIGIEAENSGDLDNDPWPEIQLDAYYRGVAALLQKIGAGPSMCCGHREYATPTGRKVDPTLDMALFRSKVASYMGGLPPKPPIAALDAMQRPTLRRGNSGDFVGKAQGLLGLSVTNLFDAGTEAKLRKFQSSNGLVPDGILGPETWKKLQPPAGAPQGAGSQKSAASPGTSAADLASIILPIAETSGKSVTIDGIYAIGPDGTRFAHRSRSGFQTIVDVKLSVWLASPEAERVCATDSQRRVVCAMNPNEGGLEAVNSYDDSFLSFGALQWTIGLEDQAGELAALLQKFKKKDPDAYADCFGSSDLDVVVAENATTGYLSLRGVTLRTAESKEQMRSGSWAYRFWRAGHHPVLRACQVESAVSRIDLFYDTVVEGRPIRQWITSELGVALLLDENVNRPTHLPKTLGEALRAMQPQPPQDLAEWTTADEHRLIMAYIDARRTTTMTDSDSRATAIITKVSTGELSDARKSYIA